MIEELEIDKNNLNDLLKAFDVILEDEGVEESLQVLKAENPKAFLEIYMKVKEKAELLSRAEELDSIEIKVIPSDAVVINSENKENILKYFEQLKNKKFLNEETSNKIRTNTEKYKKADIINIIKDKQKVDILGWEDEESIELNNMINDSDV